MQRRLAIVGRGTAGSQTVIHFLKHAYDAEVCWYFDPKILPQSVGEGSTFSLPKNLYYGLNFNYLDMDKIDSTFKTGVYKSGWGNTGNSFLHQFPPPSVSFHFNAVALQNHIFESVKNRVKIFEENVDVSSIDADLIIDCSGKPRDSAGFINSPYIPVNAAYITQCYWDYPRFQHTLAIARPYGWIFGIPLKNRCSIGYLYNRNINAEDDVIKDVQNIFEEYNLTPSENINSLKFDNYYRSSNFDHGICYNGNASFFLEPLEATSIEFIQIVNNISLDIWNNSIDRLSANEVYSKIILQIETMIMLHYFSGSVYDTDFWKYAKEQGRKCIENAAKTDQDFIRMMNKSMTHRHESMHSNDFEYGTWWPGAFSQNIFGLGIDKLLKDLL